MLFDSDPKMRASLVWVIVEIGHHQPKFKDLLKIVECEKEPLVQDNIPRAGKKIAWREKGMRVLVIDNEREFLRELFRKMAHDGMHIIVTFDGKAGLIKKASGLGADKCLIKPFEYKDLRDIILSENETTAYIKAAK